MATEAQIAWAAGLFEGEGCIAWAKPLDDEVSLATARLILNSTDSDVVERFAGIVGCGQVVHVPSPRAQWKDQWSWRCGAWLDVVRVLGLIVPHLGERRSAKALEILEKGHLSRERECPACGGLFMATKAQKKWCSRTCGKRGARAAARAA